MKQTNLKNIKEALIRVVYSHKTHEKSAEMEEKKAVMIKWANIFLTTLTSGSIFANIVTDENVLLYLSSFISALALTFFIFQLSFHPDERAQKHRQVAKELWYLRECYKSLLTDIENDQIGKKELGERRSQLAKELALVYKFAPHTPAKAFPKAQEELE